MRFVFNLPVTEARTQARLNLALSFTFHSVVPGGVENKSVASNEERQDLDKWAEVFT